MVCTRPTLLLICFPWEIFVFLPLGTRKANTYAGEGEKTEKGRGDSVDEGACYSGVVPAWSGIVHKNMYIYIYIYIYIAPW